MLTAARTTLFRMIPNDIAPFALIELPDGSINTRWMTGAERTRLVQEHAASEDESLLPDLALRLERYFAGEVVEFDDVPTPTVSGRFTQRCWSACRAIPRGRTRSYAELAAAAGSPDAARAAGQAMRTNTLSIIIPCHRVVNSAGKLHGYAGQTDDRSQSLEIKRHLLALEGAL